MCQFEDKAAQGIKAPYTFIPADGRVVLSPIYNGAREPDFSRPFPDGLSGCIKVEWQVETPTLIGASGDQNKFVQMGEGGKHVLPGSSLRGMLRSVLESAAFARLSFIDEERYFSLRDFQAPTLQAGIKSAVRAEHPNAPNQIHLSNNPQYAKAAWLLINVKTKQAALQKTAWKKLPVESLVERIATVGSSVKWLQQTWEEKRRLLNDAGLCAGDDGFTPVPMHGMVNDLESGCIIHAGTDPTNSPNKASEAVFVGAPQRDILQKVAEGGKRPDGFWKLDHLQVIRFLTIQPQQSAASAEDRGDRDHWSLWTHYKQQASADGWCLVPVFVVGPWNDLSEKPRPGRAFLSLTRFVRVPYAYSVADIAKRTQEDPDDTKLDLVQALFGWAAPERDDQEDQPHTNRVDTDRAWRSRVFIGHATIEMGAIPLETEETRIVTMTPRPSYFPFYLRHNGANPTVPVDWSHEKAILAGRKRYPARMTSNAPQPGAAEQQLANPVEMLKATPAAPQKFKGEIRFKNLLPAELGALLWAIGFGHVGIGDDGKSPLCHMLGRGKAFGFGQVRAVLTAISFRESKQSGTPTPWLSASGKDIKVWMETYATHVLAQREEPAPAPVEVLTAYHDLHPIRLLRNTGNAQSGKRVRQYLTWPTQPPRNQDGSPIIEGYKEIRNLSQGEYVFLPDYEP